MKAALFDERGEKRLIPTLSPGAIVVMDNSPAHKGARSNASSNPPAPNCDIRRPSSPDMNPIEKTSSKLKAIPHKFAERTVAGLMRALDACADILKPTECTSHFAACGYDPT
jgi:transposase